jgi:hypothetical protein
MRNTLMCQKFRNTECSFFRGIQRGVLRTTVMCQRNLGIQNAVCHRNLESCNAKYRNESEKFRNAECSLSHEFREM